MEAKLTGGCGEPKCGSVCEYNNDMIDYKGKKRNLEKRRRVSETKIA